MNRINIYRIYNIQLSLVKKQSIFQSCYLKICRLFFSESCASLFLFSVSQQGMPICGVCQSVSSNDNPLWKVLGRGGEEKLNTVQFECIVNLPTDKFTGEIFTFSLSFVISLWVSLSYSSISLLFSCFSSIFLLIFNDIYENNLKWKYHIDIILISIKI